MLLEYFVPPDNDAMRAEYENRKVRGGTCGPSCIAALAHKTVKEVIDNWSGRGDEGFRGYAPTKEMKATLKKLGYDAVTKRGNKAREFPLPNTDAAIIRIQWLKDDGQPWPWYDAPKYTHYVLLQKQPDGFWAVFCNGVNGWFLPWGAYASEYINGPPGYVSSYMELSKAI